MHTLTADGFGKGPAFESGEVPVARHFSHPGFDVERGDLVASGCGGGVDRCDGVGDEVVALVGRGDAVEDSGFEGVGGEPVGAADGGAVAVAGVAGAVAVAAAAAVGGGAEVVLAARTLTSPR